MQSNVPFEAYQLGNEVATFTTHRALGSRLVKEVIFVVVGVVAIWLASMEIIPAIMIFLLIMMVFALAMNSIEIFRHLLVLNRKLQIFENGFIFKQGQKTTVAKWSDIKTVNQNIRKYSVNRVPIMDIHRYVITTNDNQTLVINRLQDGIEKIGHHIQVQAANSQFPATFQALARGEDVYFGEQLAINKVGIAARGGKILWPDFESFDVKSGNVIFQARNPDGSKRKSRNVEVPVGIIDNLYVLLGVLENRERWLRTEPTTVPTT